MDKRILKLRELANSKKLNQCVIRYWEVIIEDHQRLVVEAQAVVDAAQKKLDTVYIQFAEAPTKLLKLAQLMKTINAETDKLKNVSRINKTEKMKKLKVQIAALEEQLS